jgi:aspartyl-tRNA(Asn)/glutamyl-tRNA(Gln) amidotransferase subunit B
MENVYDKYEAVIGLEVHAQLITKSKVYSSDANEYGALPNTNVSVVSLGHPGTLPKLNKRVIKHAVRLGLACKADITRDMHFDRKNYFYADLPKGYQITQDKTPICTNGFIRIKKDNGEPKNINLTRIHIEEDAGKSIHDQDPFDTLVDLNRAGVPLLEIVTEPEIKTSTEAYNYLTEVRKLVRYLEVCDGNMEEGSMRCDANVSVMLKGATEFGNRTEVKNMNSIRNVQRAIDFEIKRQIDAIEQGETIATETRTFNAVDGSTAKMRSKEMAHDYRYFPEPDLQPISVSQEYIDKMEAGLPPLPNDLVKKYTEKLGLSEYDALVLTDSKDVALYFEELIQHTNDYKLAANWIMGDVKSYLNQKAVAIEEFPIRPEALASLIQLIKDGKVSNAIASQKIFPKLLENPTKSPSKIAEENNWIQDSNEDALVEMIAAAIGKFPDKVKEYQSGKKNLVGLFMGEVMKASRGTADPKMANQLVRKMLEEVKTD